MERTNSIQWNPYISMFFIDAGRALYVFFMGTSYLFSMDFMLSAYFLICFSSIRKGKATGSSV